MKAKAGDHLVILGRHVHRPVRDGEIVEVRGSAGQPPYLVRWSDTRHETLLYPGSDARIEPVSPSPPTADTSSGAVGRTARTAEGQPTLNRAEVVALVREHIDLEKLRTNDYDHELWSLWQDETSSAQADAHKADVLDRVLARLRTGE